MFHLTAQDWEWATTCALIFLALPTTVYGVLCVEGFRQRCPQKFAKGTLAAEGIAEMKRENRRFLWTSLKGLLFNGPVIFVILLGAVTVFWEAKYEQAAKSFQETIHQERTAALVADAAKQDGRGDAALYYKDRALFDAEVTKSMLRSHPLGYHPAKDQLLFQQIEGYKPNGDLIWSNEVHVFRVLPGTRELEKCIFLLPEQFRGSAEPATLRQLQQALAQAKETDRRTWGHTFSSFEVAENPTNGRRFDVKIQMGLQVEGSNGVYTFYIYQNFPPSPRPGGRE